MKMAKASAADIEMAMELCGALDSLTGHWPTLPAGLCSQDEDAPDETFDCDDDRQCGTVLRHLLAIAERASLMRVVWGMVVLLDPRNKMVDPDADTLEHHPENVAARKLAEQQAAQIAEKDAEIARLTAELEALKGDLDPLFKDLTEADELADLQATRIQALRADAERYRWLKDAPATLESSPLREWLWARPFGVGQNLDATIDAALRQEQPTKGEGA